MKKIVVTNSKTLTYRMNKSEAHSSIRHEKNVKKYAHSFLGLLEKLGAIVRYIPFFVVSLLLTGCGREQAPKDAGPESAPKNDAQQVSMPAPHPKLDCELPHPKISAEDLAPVVHEKTLAEWMQTLTGKDRGTRMQAANALSRIARIDKSAFPLLREALRHEDFDVREKTAHCLSLLGPAGASVLADALTDDNHYVRIVAARTLLSMYDHERKGSLNSWKRSSIPIAMCATLP